MTPIDTLFHHMDHWRHLPAYQLERRADLFFSAYLPAVVAEHTGTPIAPDLIPELPIRRDLIWPDRPSRTSVKVDYALFAADRSKVFFVELKTDNASRRDRQDAYLARSVDIGFQPIVQGIVDISQATQERQKYGHLLHALARHGCLRLPPELDAHLWPKPRRGLRRLLEQVEVTVADDELAVEVLYVQPRGGGRDTINFDAFASFVEQHEDGLSQRFAASLRAWVRPAGQTPP